MNLKRMEEAARPVGIGTYMGPKRMALLVGGLFGAVLMALVPVYFMPAYDPKTNKMYREIQKQARAGVDQESIQPGGMRVWSDPFGRKKASD